jgi:hypothetical protein
MKWSGDPIVAHDRPLAQEPRLINLERRPVSARSDHTEPADCSAMLVLDCELIGRPAPVRRGQRAANGSTQRQMTVPKTPLPAITKRWNSS